MNINDYSKIEITGVFKAVNWQEFVDLLSKTYDPLSLRTFLGSANPPIIDSYTRSHWNNSENKIGFGESIIRNSDRDWLDFKFCFYDKDDENRFIKIEIDCRKKKIKLSASLDNKIKLDNFIEKIKNILVSFYSENFVTDHKNKEGSNKLKKQPSDRVNYIIGLARANPIIASIIAVGIIIIAIGAVATNLDNIINVSRKYFPFSQKKVDVPKPSYEFYFQEKKENHVEVSDLNKYEIGFKNISGEPLLNFQFTIYFSNPIETIKYEHERSSAVITGGKGLSSDKKVFHWRGNQIVEDDGWAVFSITAKRKLSIKKISTKLFGKIAGENRFILPDLEGLSF